MEKEKVITFNREAMKKNREARKAERDKAKADRQANKKSNKVGRTIGIIASYICAVGAAVVGTVEVMRHMGAMEAQAELEGLHPVEDVPFEVTDVEVAEA